MAAAHASRSALAFFALGIPEPLSVMSTLNWRAVASVGGSAKSPVEGGWFITGVPSGTEGILIGSGAAKIPLI